MAHASSASSDDARKAYGPIVESAVRAARWRLIPFLLLMYVAAFIDRVNVGFAKQHLQSATGMSEAVFAFGASLFFITYLIFEVPSNLALRRFGAKLWMCRIMVIWGVVSASTAFVSGNTSFYINRLLLGAAEAGFFPGMVLYLTYWFPSKYRLPIVGLFYIGSPLAFVIGGPLSSFILSFGSSLGMTNWQLMFVFEGLLSVVVGIAALFILTDKPAKARWLSAEQRSELEAVVEAEDQAKVDHGHGSIASALKDSAVVRFIICYVLIQMGNAVVQFYLPSQISRLLGPDAGMMVGWLVAVPWMCALIAALTVPRLAAGKGNSRWWGAAGLTVAAIGLAGSASSSPAIAVFCLCMAVGGSYAAQPIFWQTVTRYFGGIAAAAGVAFINAVGNIGGFFAPNVRAYAETAFSFPNAAAFILAGTTLLAALLFLVLPRSEDALSSDDLKSIKGVVPASA
jgi:MFS family permease